MIWFGSLLFVACAVGLFVARRPAAQWEALIIGGRVSPGCVTVQAAGFLILALAYYLVLRG